MDILLHLGAHRCAATTFQRYIATNHRMLAKRGLSCWTPRRTRDGLLAGLLVDPALITLRDEYKAARSTGRLRIGFDLLQRSGQAGVLISDQNLLGTTRANVEQTALYPLAGERLMRFRSAFEGRKLRIGLCIRSYEHYWTSCLSSLVARGGAVPGVDTLDFLTTHPRRWRHLVRDVATAFPTAEIKVWPFERMAAQPEAQLRALWGDSCVGLSDDAAITNRSPDLARLNDMMAARGAAPLVGVQASDGARWMPFDEDQRNVLRAEYRRDLAWLVAGGQGLAQYVDGRQQDDDHHNDQYGPHRPSTPPDRADVIRTGVYDTVHFKGQNDGTEKRRIENAMGRTGAS